MIDKNKTDNSINNKSNKNKEAIAAILPDVSYSGAYLFAVFYEMLYES